MTGSSDTSLKTQLQNLSAALSKTKEELASAEKAEAAAKKAADASQEAADAASGEALDARSAMTAVAEEAYHGMRDATIEAEAAREEVDRCVLHEWSSFMP